MSSNKTKGEMGMKSILKDAWTLGKEKKFLNLMNAGFAGGMACVYFETFIFAFDGKNTDPDIAHAVLMIKTFLVAFILLSVLNYALTKQSKGDELGKQIRKNALQISHIFLIVALIGSLLSWAFHKSTATVFHFVSLSLIISYALYYFMSSIKHMSFMATPSLFDLDSQD